MLMAMMTTTRTMTVLLRSARFATCLRGEGDGSTVRALGKVCARCRM
jgi:hypothetical protein